MTAGAPTKRWNMVLYFIGYADPEADLLAGQELQSFSQRRRADIADILSQNGFRDHFELHGYVGQDGFAIWLDDAAYEYVYRQISGIRIRLHRDEPVKIRPLAGQP